MKTLEERFRDKYKIRDDTGCWLWIAACNNMGYGVVCDGGKMVLAHRVSYKLYVGGIPTGEGYHGTCVLHRCDVPNCVNPDHLMLGTHKDNMGDCKAKGRHRGGAGSATPKGGDHYNTNLNATKAMEIFELAQSGVGLREIGDIYGIKRQAVSKIKLKTSWGHIHQ